jgi:Brp/Blh family beta-carotene 15,15'-monooxygenase
MSVLEHDQVGSIEVICFIFIIILGLPHGAIDPWLYDKSMISQPRALLLFAGCYISAALMMLVVWYFIPLLALIVFFSLSALHFGRDWQNSENNQNVTERLSAGVIVIAWPFLLQTEQTLLIINYLGVSDTSALFLSALILLLLAVSQLIFSSQFLILFKLLLLGGMSWLVSPFIYFCLYFCLLHSILHYRHHFDIITLAFQKNRLVLILILTFTYLFTAIMLVFANHYAQLGTAIYQTVFWILSALTVPHMFLVERQYKRVQY